MGRNLTGGLDRDLRCGRDLCRGPGRYRGLLRLVPRSGLADLQGLERLRALRSIRRSVEPRAEHLLRAIFAFESPSWYRVWQMMPLQTIARWKNRTGSEREGDVLFRTVLKNARWRLGHRFYDHRYALAATDAGARNTVASVAAAKLEQQRENEARAACSERVT